MEAELTLSQVFPLQCSLLPSPLRPGFPAHLRNSEKHLNVNVWMLDKICLNILQHLVNYLFWLTFYWICYITCPFTFDRILLTSIFTILPQKSANSLDYLGSGGEGGADCRRQLWRWGPGGLHSSWRNSFCSEERGKALCGALMWQLKG